MAARRLIAVMLVLLFLSSLAAALAPVDRPSDETSTTPTTTTTPEPAAFEPGLVRATLDLRKPDPAPVRVRVGDQLELRVVADRPATVELVELGEAEDVDRFAPAIFDLLLDRKGDIRVRDLERRRPLGTIRVLPSRPARTEPEPDQARARS